jgi:hypothetical protein
LVQRVESDEVTEGADGIDILALDPRAGDVNRSILTDDAPGEPSFKQRTDGEPIQTGRHDFQSIGKGKRLDGEQDLALIILSERVRVV